MMNIQSVEHVDAAIKQLQLLRTVLLKEVTHPEVPTSSVLAKHQDRTKVWDVKPGARRLVAKFSYQASPGDLFDPTPEVLFQEDGTSDVQFLRNCSAVFEDNLTEGRALADFEIHYQKDAPTMSAIDAPVPPGAPGTPLTLADRIKLAKEKGVDFDPEHWTSSTDDQADLNIFLDGFDIPRHY